MQKNFISKLTLFMVIVMIAAGFSACAVRGDDLSGDESSISVTGEEDIIEGAGRSDTAPNVLPNLVDIVNDLWSENDDTVGWLRVPGTTIDDVVVFKEDDNDFYMRRNFEKQYYFNGIFYADKRSVFAPNGSLDGLGRNTVVYGHSMSDSRDDIQFGPTRYFLDEEFARTHPYIFLSTLQDDLAWEVVAVFYTNWDVPYNRNDLSYSEFQAMFDEVSARSVYDYGVEISEDDKFLTLSTCVYSLPGKGLLEYPNIYRFGIMARLVEPGTALKDEADFTKNNNVKAA